MADGLSWRLLAFALAFGFFPSKLFPISLRLSFGAVLALFVAGGNLAPTLDSFVAPLAYGTLLVEVFYGLALGAGVSALFAGWQLLARGLVELLALSPRSARRDTVLSFGAAFEALVLCLTLVALFESGRFWEPLLKLLSAPPHAATLASFLSLGAAAFELALSLGLPLLAVFLSYELLLLLVARALQRRVDAELIWACGVPALALLLLLSLQPLSRLGAEQIERNWLGLMNER